MTRYSSLISVEQSLDIRLLHIFQLVLFCASIIHLFGGYHTIQLDGVSHFSFFLMAYTQLINSFVIISLTSAMFSSFCASTLVASFLVLIYCVMCRLTIFNFTKRGGILCVNDSWFPRLQIFLVSILSLCLYVILSLQ